MVLFKKKREREAEDLQGIHSNISLQVQAENLAKCSDNCSIKADGLCIGSPRLVGGRKVGNSNMQEFFCTTL